MVLVFIHRYGLLQGTFHYNSLQDQHLQHYFEQPSIRKHLEAMGVVSNLQEYRLVHIIFILA